MKLSVDFHRLHQALNWTEISQTNLRTLLLPIHRSRCFYVDLNFPLSCVGQLDQLTNPAENCVLLLLGHFSAEIASWTDFWVGPRENIFWCIKRGTTHLFTRGPYEVWWHLPKCFPFCTLPVFPHFHIASVRLPLLFFTYQLFLHINWLVEEYVI